MDAKRFSEEVTKELVELKKLGVRVSKGAFAMAADVEHMAELTNMGVSDAADFCRELN